MSDVRGGTLAFFAMIFGGAFTFAMPIVLVTLHTVAWTHDGFWEAAPAYSIIENESDANIRFQELPEITAGGARIKQTFIRARHKLSDELLEWLTVGVGSDDERCDHEEWNRKHFRSSAGWYFKADCKENHS